jgi:hypothetical protein
MAGEKPVSLGSFDDFFSAFLGPAEKEEKGEAPMPGLHRYAQERMQPAGAPEALGEPFFTGQWPDMPAAPTFTPVSAPDFSAARQALGEPPERPAEQDKMQTIARVLGGAAAGALRGLRGEGSTGAVLAGAGGGTGAAMGQIAREEEARQKDWRDSYQRHKQNEARIESMAASAKSDTERYNANMQLQVERMNWIGEVEEARRRAPQVSVNGTSGIATVAQVSKDGTYTVNIVDTQRDLRMAIALAKAQGKDKTRFYGETVDTSSLTEEQRVLGEMANTMLSTGRYLEEPFRSYLDAVMAEYFEGSSIEKEMGNYASHHIEFEDFERRMTFAIMLAIGRAGEDAVLRQMQGQLGAQ